MTAFGDAIDLNAVAPGTFAWQVPPGWEQGRGAWGGLVVGACLTAVTSAQSDRTRTLRTIAAHLYAPVVSGPASVRAQLIRQGSSMSTWSVAIRDEQDVAMAEAVVITGEARAADLDADLVGHGTATMPVTPEWAHCPVIPIVPPLGPAFGSHLEFRPIQGLPFAQDQARVLGWIRLPDQGPWSAVEALSMADAYWPSLYPMLQQLRPMATVSFSAHLLVDPSTLPAGEPLLFESSMAAGHQGFTTETRRLWSSDGRLVVENLQSVVVIR